MAGKSAKKSKSAPKPKKVKGKFVVKKSAKAKKNGQEENKSANRETISTQRSEDAPEGLAFGLKCLLEAGDFDG